MAIWGNWEGAAKRVGINIWPDSAQAISTSCLKFERKIACDHTQYYGMQKLLRSKRIPYFAMKGVWVVHIHHIHVKMKKIEVRLPYDLKKKKRRTFEWLVQLIFDEKQIKILDHFKALWKYSYLAPIFFCSEMQMALVRVKMLPISVLQSLCKSAFEQNSASLLKDLASKPLEIETWDWSRMKDFFCLFYQ